MKVKYNFRMQYIVVFYCEANQYTGETSTNGDATKIAEITKDLDVLVFIKYLYCKLTFVLQ